VAIAMASAQATAAAAAPAYVTAWPRQVEVLQPDPVLGDKPYFEHWVYSRAFAERFRGTTDGQTFTPEQADPELEGRKLYALVLRIYKINQWAGVDKDYPKQYTCEIEMYFNDTIPVPLSPSLRTTAYADHPDGIKAGYTRLITIDELDTKALAASRPVEQKPQHRALIFAVPLDGRVHFYGVAEYRRELVPGISSVILRAGWKILGCKVAAPQRPGGSDWISLGLVQPYEDLDLKRAVEQGYSSRFETLSFDPGPDPESRGLFRIPRTFHAVALEKAALVKVMNWCIAHRHNPSDWRVSRTTQGWSKTFTHKELMQRCEQAERFGRILPDPRYHPEADGLMDTGY
jgi:hypothetical protein